MAAVLGELPPRRRPSAAAMRWARGRRLRMAGLLSSSPRRGRLGPPSGRSWIGRLGGSRTKRGGRGRNCRSRPAVSRQARNRMVDVSRIEHRIDRSRLGPATITVVGLGMIGGQIAWKLAQLFLGG